MLSTSELDYNIALNRTMMTDNGALDVSFTLKRTQQYQDLFNSEEASIPEQTYFDTITTYRPNNGDWYVGMYAET